MEVREKLAEWETMMDMLTGERDTMETELHQVRGYTAKNNFFVLIKKT